MQLYSSASDCTLVGNIPGSENLFSCTFAFLMTSLASQKRRLFIADFKLAGKNQQKPIQEYMGDTPILSHCCLVRNP
jgi:hypothetical protein